MLNDLTALAESTVGLSLCILVLLALGPLLSKRVSPRWRYHAWMLLAVSPVVFLAGSNIAQGSLPTLFQIPVPQAVEAGAYDRYQAYLQDNERLVEAGGGGMGGAMTSVGGENQWLRHHVH